MNVDDESSPKKRADKVATDNVTVTVDKSDVKKIEKSDPDDPKPRIVLTFRSEKSNTKSSNMKIVPTEEKQEEVSPRRSSRTRGKWDWVCDSDASISPKKEKSQPVSETDESDSSHVATKRTRRRSKDENIIATAIARKEKSYNEATPGPTQRPSRRIKPTAKVLANEELRMGLESQNNARLGISNDKSPEEGVRTRRSARPPPAEEKTKSAKSMEMEEEQDVVEIDDDSQDSDMKLQHLCKLGLKAIEVEEVEVKEELEETEMLEDDEEEVDDDSEVISKLLEADEDTDDEDFLCSISASSRGRQPRRSTRLCHSYSRNDSDRSSPVPDDDKSRSRRSTRLAAPHSDDTDSKSHRSPRKRKSFPEEVHSEADLEDESALADADEGSEAAGPPEDSTIIASCLCETTSNIYADPGELKEPVFCQAIELVDGVRVGCSHGASVSSCLRRAGPRAPYFLPCTLHSAQLNKHMCCPACGLFCTQGIFYQCSKNHLFHLECALPYNDSKARPGCPHCGVYSYRWQPVNTACWKVKLEMQCSNKRIFLPDQREQCTPAYLGFSSSSPNTEQPPIIPSDLLPPPAVLKRLSNKKDRVNCSPQELADAIIAMEDVETLASKIGGNVNIRVPSESGGTAVHVASRVGHVAALYLLHLAGADLDATDDSMRTPLIVAVQALVASSEDVKDQEDTKEMEVDQQSEMAKQEDLMKVIQFLIAAGCNVNCAEQGDQLTALHMAAARGASGAVGALLAGGATLDARDAGGWTPLVWAAENDHHGVVTQLLEAGADAAALDAEGNSGAVWCAAAGAARALPLLLRRRPHLVHVTNGNGDTPLHVAARQGQYSCVIILLAHGARCDVENSAGELPGDVCSGASQTAISLNMQMKMAVKDNITPYKLLSSDISKGREMYPIPCINAVDDEPLPSDFTYVTSHVTPYPLSIDYTIQTLQGCSCGEESDCTSSGCSCVVLGVRGWWRGGRLLPTFPHHDPPMLFHCNPTCSCNAKKCNNNTITKLSSRGSVFVPSRVERISPTVGWGLVSSTAVPKGSPVALYTGELLPLHMADTRSDDTYMFALDVKPDLLESERACVEKETLCVDARQYGGAARFVNHSCRPNLAPLRLYTHTRDLRLPAVALFALTHIQPDEQFTFDYGDKFWSVKSKYMRCECGTPECRYPAKTKEETESS